MPFNNAQLNYNILRIFNLILGLNMLLIFENIANFGFDPYKK